MTREDREPMSSRGLEASLDPEESEEEEEEDSELEDERLGARSPGAWR